jgi:hypothetical protein
MSGYRRNRRELIMHRIRMKKPLVAASVLLTVAGGALAITQTSAHAATNLSVTLSATGANAKVAWNADGNPVLSAGSGSAKMTVNNPPFTAPADAPSFGSNGMSGNSPHWSVQFNGGATLLGLSTDAGKGNAWEILAPGTTCNANPPAGFATWATQLAFIQNHNCGGNVESAAIIADAAGQTVALSTIQYDDMTLVAGPDVVTVTSPGNQTSTLGTAITPLQIQASSNKGDAIASYSATGLPSGLSIDAAKGTISGTPNATGTFSVTVTAMDNGGTKGTASFTWSVGVSTPPPHVTYSGTIRLFKMGLCLDDALNSSHSGAIVQVWRCNGMPNQDWQVLSNGTIKHNGLCLDARNFGTHPGTPIQLWACTGGPNQQWDTRGFRVHYDNPNAFSQVLDDTAFGGNGTRQELFTNNGGVNQQWATF